MIDKAIFRTPFFMASCHGTDSSVVHFSAIRKRAFMFERVPFSPSGINPSVKYHPTLCFSSVSPMVCSDHHRKQQSKEKQ
jgi:hypothetical protein